MHENPMVELTALLKTPIAERYWRGE